MQNESGSGQAIALIYLDKCSKNRYFRPLRPNKGQTVVAYAANTSDLLLQNAPNKVLLRDTIICFCDSLTCETGAAVVWIIFNK